MKEKALLQHAEHISQIGSWEWDISRNEWQFSEGFRRIHGIVDPTPMRMHDLWEVAYPADRPAIERAFDQALCGADHYDIEHRIVRRTDGAIRYVHARGEAEFDAGGNPTKLFGVTQDITDREVTRNALQSSNERLRYALDATSEGIWDWNVQTGEVYFSDQWIGSLGYTRDEVSPSVQFWQSLVHPDDWPQVQAKIQAHFAGLTAIYECENRLRTRQGEYRYNLDRGKVVAWGEDGAPLRMVGADIDITERKRAELVQARLAAIVESTDDAIIGKDLDGVITDWNAGAARLYGYAADEVIGRSVSMLFPTQSTEHLTRILQQLRQGERVPPYDTLRKTKDGRLLDVSLTISPLKDANGEVIGASTIARDISQRRAMEEELRESEERFRTMWDISPTPQMLTRFRDNVAVFANQAAANLLRLPIEQLTGTDVTNHWVEPELRSKLMKTVRRDGVVRDVELRVRRGNGELFWLLYSAALLSYHGEEVVLVTGIDISERKAANEELEARVVERTAQLEVALIELQRADQAKDAFLAAVSHELRTPLTAVLSMTDALEMQLTGQLNERQLHYVGQMRLSGERLLKMVNSILHYTALLAGRVQLQPETCRLVELCAMSLRTIREQATHKDQKLKLTIEPNDLEITSDANSVLQVLGNLLDNAVKFTPRGGEIGILAAADNTHTVVDITVWDTGIGIAPDRQHTIFDPFEQIDAGLTRHYEGIGLGLAFVSRMSRQLGGSITLQSAPEQGSRFTLTLPIAPAWATQQTLRS